MFAPTNYCSRYAWRPAGNSPPHKTHAHKDAAASAEFQGTLCVQLKDLNVAGGRPVRVWVADEHCYGLIPVVRRCWTLRGVRPTAPHQTQYEGAIPTARRTWTGSMRRSLRVCRA